MMCVEESNGRSVFHRHTAKRGDAFCLGERAGILTDVDGEQPLLVHVAVAEVILPPLRHIFYDIPSLLFFQISVYILIYIINITLST